MATLEMQTCSNHPTDVDGVTPEPELLRQDGDPATCERRMLTIHAHPDDEASKGGGSAARYAAEGVGVVLVCCTGGEAGSILNPALDRPEVKVNLPAVRRRELIEATAHLGYGRVWMLGYRDSNMPASNEPGTFAAAALDETVRALVRIIRRERPHVVVTYPANQRGYRHPDHLRVHDATMPAYKAARDPAFHPELGVPWAPQKLYYVLWSRASLVARHKAFVQHGLKSPFKPERWKRRRSMDHFLTTKVFIGRSLGTDPPAPCAPTPRRSIPSRRSGSACRRRWTAPPTRMTTTSWPAARCARGCRRTTSLQGSTATGCNPPSPLGRGSG